MKKILLLLVAVAFVWLPAQAQVTYSKADVFGGLALLSTEDINGDNSRELFTGWQVSVAGNVHRNVGLVADFGGQYKTIEGFKLHAYSYLFGPRFNVRADKTTVFAEALLGGVRVGGEGFSQNLFALGFGGGVDVKASNRVSIRVIEFDWLPNHSEGYWSKKEVRILFGVVFHVGGGS